MSRIYFDANCNNCGPVVILEGNPMKCPKCSEYIEIKPVILERQTPGRIEGRPALQNVGKSPGKETF